MDVEFSKYKEAAKFMHNVLNKKLRAAGAVQEADYGDSLLERIRTAHKFKMPRNAVIGDKRHAVFPMPFRLPFPTTVLEMEVDLFGDREAGLVGCDYIIVLAEESVTEDGERIVTINSISRMRDPAVTQFGPVWAPCDFQVEICDRTHTHQELMERVQGGPLGSLKDLAADKSKIVNMVKNIASALNNKSLNFSMMSIVNAPIFFEGDISKPGTARYRVWSDKNAVKYLNMFKRPMTSFTTAPLDMNGMLELAYKNLQAEIFAVCSLIDALRCRNVFVTPQNKAREPGGKLENEPVPCHEFRILKLEVPSDPVSYEPRGGTHASPVEHWTRGHSQRYHTKSGVKLVWKSAYIKGSGERGSVTKDYTIDNRSNTKEGQ
jgi:hypothetical protein